MKQLYRALLASIGFGAIAASALAQTAFPPPQWAFPIDPPGKHEKAGDGQLLHLAGSEAAYTPTQLDDLFAPPDWYPGDHPPMPGLVAHGAQPMVFACGFCHMPNGAGRPENARLAGLKAAYIIRQVQDFMRGTRRTVQPAHKPSMSMMALAQQAAFDPGLAEAAAYFASLKPVPLIKVVETAVVPKTEISHWVFKKSAAGGSEPIGDRIIEMPDDFARFEMRDERVTFTAYAPVGSLKKGQLLVITGGGKTHACTQCHGADLRGFGNAPPLAGRSPGSLARQIFNFQAGARQGDFAAVMKPVVAKLTIDDVVAITAYLAAQKP